jgi:hypothetical protein
MQKAKTGNWAQVDLGPPLPMPIYTCLETWHAERIGALALYCSDGRWGEAFDEFCHRRLLIPRYDRWAVPGGPAWLVQRESALHEAARTQLDFLVRFHELERIVLITHFGCAYYTQRLHKDADACLSAQLDELRVASATLHDWFPEIGVEAYVAVQRGKTLSFCKLEG